MPDDDAAEGGTSHANGRADTGPGGEGAEEGGKKLSGAQRKKLAKEERKKQRGANKGRRFQKVRDDLELCFKVASGKPCEFGDEYVHPACASCYSLTGSLPGAASRMTFLRISLQSPETFTSLLLKISPMHLLSCGSRMWRWPKRGMALRVLST